MGSRTLFETLTGYEEPAAAEPDGQQILSAGTGEPQADAGAEPNEDQFAAILEELDRRADTDPLFVQKLADAFGIQPDKAHIKEKLRESKAIVEQARGSGLLGPGAPPPDFSEQERALETPEPWGYRMTSAIAMSRSMSSNATGATCRASTSSRSCGASRTTTRSVSWAGSCSTA
jgi:hypothetical protein